MGSKEEHELESKKYERKGVEKGDYEEAKWGENYEISTCKREQRSRTKMVEDEEEGI
jgi:hypothetical protein